MPRLTQRNPKYRLHRASGQAVVTIGGRDHYLGIFDSSASRKEYDRLIAQWLAQGRPSFLQVEGPTVTEVIRDFWRHAHVYYRNADGQCSSEVRNLRHALLPLKRLFGETEAAKFGPLRLKTLQEEMIRMGWCRTHINRQIGRVKHFFKWATENELVPPGVFQALATVQGLKAGRSTAKESDPVTPVEEDKARATLPHVSAQVKAMIQLQLLTGMRPGEVCAMRGCDLDMKDALWVYRPPQHKTRHHGHRREIFIGERAKEILKPFLKPDVTAYLFSPADARAEWLAMKHAARLEGGTPLSCGNRPGTNVKANPKKTPGAKYSVESYCRAIQVGCEKAFGMPKQLRAKRDDTPEQKLAKSQGRAQWRSANTWHLHQLRHTAAKKLREQYGLEAAQVILGHRTLSVTQVYAEKNVSAARKVMSEVG